jgi:chromate transport protein ChrA
MWATWFIGAFPAHRLGHFFPAHLVHAVETLGERPNFKPTAGVGAAMISIILLCIALLVLGANQADPARVVILVLTVLALLCAVFKWSPF